MNTHACIYILCNVMFMFVLRADRLDIGWPVRVLVPREDDFSTLSTPFVACRSLFTAEDSCPSLHLVYFLNVKFMPIYKDL